MSHAELATVVDEAFEKRDSVGPATKGAVREAHRAAALEAFAELETALLGQRECPECGNLFPENEAAKHGTEAADAVVVAALGIVFGLLSGSYAIVFDGIYSLADGVTSVAALLVAKTDRHRRVYYHHHTGKFWGHSSCYDLTVNTGVLGVEKTAETMEAFIRTFWEQD